MVCPTGPITQDEHRFAAIHIPHYRRMAAIEDEYLPSQRRSIRVFFAIGVLSMLSGLGYGAMLAEIHLYLGLISLPFFAIAVASFRYGFGVRTRRDESIVQRDCYMARADALEAM